MSQGRATLLKYALHPWLRRRGIDMLREEHVARWCFEPGQVVVREWCGLCGAPNHLGVIVSVEEPYAIVRLVCQSKAVKLSKSLLRHPVPPFSKEVLDLRHQVRKEIRR